jgi:hypothetical protein
VAAPSSAGPATHFGSAAIVVAAAGLAAAAAATSLGAATTVHTAVSAPQAAPAESVADGNVYKFLTGLSSAGAAQGLGSATLTLIVSGLPGAGPAGLIGDADRISVSLPPEQLLDLVGMPGAGPATHVADALRITTGELIADALLAEHFGDATAIHTTTSIAAAGPATAFGDADVFYPGLQLRGISAAGPALPLGPLWQRPTHMTGLVASRAIPDPTIYTPAEPPQLFVNYPGSGVAFGPLHDACRHSDYDPFKRLTVEGCYHMAVEGAVQVSWALRRDFDPPGPYTFELYRGRAVNDDAWELLATVVDQPWILDRRPAPRPHERSTYYRVRLIDGNGVSYWGHPVSFDVSWNHYDWRLVREIVRKELLIQGRGRNGARTRGAGTAGWLLKQRQFGDACPRCFDPETAAATDSHCPVCLGVGVTKGYYDPLEYWVIQEPARRITKLSNEGDTRTTVIETVRALAHPSPEPGDAWVSCTGSRYWVEEDIERLARHRGVDVVLGLRLMEAPRTSMIYTIPMPEIRRA